MPDLKFRHADDEKWQEVRAQQHGDRRVSIREKWLEFTPNFLCLYAKWDPGMMVHKHGHNSDHVVYVIEVNPRASRTVPFVSKAIGRPLAKLAALVMAGQTLEELANLEQRHVGEVGGQSILGLLLAGRRQSYRSQTLVWSLLQHPRLHHQIEVDAEAGPFDRTDAGHQELQRHALEMISRRIQTSRAALDNPGKPIGVFLLVGRADLAMMNPVAFPVYFLALAATSMRLDHRACAVAAGVAVCQYGAIVALAAGTVGLTELEIGTQGVRIVLLGTMGVLGTLVNLRMQRPHVLSANDGLTGLLNRRAFEDRWNGEVARVRRHGRPISIAAIDIDYFKQFNDTYGHAAGDTALVVVIASWPEARQAHWDALLVARAIENQQFVVGVNRVGEGGGLGFVGGTAIIDPLGRVRAHGGDEPGLVTAARVAGLGVPGAQAPREDAGGRKGRARVVAHLTSARRKIAAAKAKPTIEIVENAVEQLKAAGFEVMNVDETSISIGAPATTYESVFKTRIVPEEPMARSQPRRR